MTCSTLTHRIFRSATRRSKAGTKSLDEQDFAGVRRAQTSSSPARNRLDRQSARRVTGVDGNALPRNILRAVAAEKDSKLRDVVGCSHPLERRTFDETSPHFVFGHAAQPCLSRDHAIDTVPGHGPGENRIDAYVVPAQ